MRSTILTFRHTFRACSATRFMCTKQLLGGGILRMAGEYLVRLLQSVMLVCIWKILAHKGADSGGMVLSTLLTYILMSSVLYQQLNIISPTAAALWKGSIIGRYLGSFPMIANFVVETVGRWQAPVLLLYRLSLWLMVTLLGIQALPAGGISEALVFISLTFSMAIRFAINLMLIASAVWLKSGCFAVLYLWESIFALLSGELIPLMFFPWNLEKLFVLTPFGSITHAPLSTYTGLTDAPLFLIGLQVSWCVILWLLALYVFRKSEERMMSFDG